MTRHLLLPSRHARLLPGLTLLAALLLAATAAAAPAPRIIGGNNADDQEYPFMVSLVRPDGSTDLSAHFCGGTLLSDRWVLTAGHCVSKENGNLIPASDVKVIVGETQLSRTAAVATRRAVDAIVRHPAYDSDPQYTLTNDIALLRLTTAVAPAPAVVTLASDPFIDTLLLHADLVAIGWGFVQENPAALEETLQEVTLAYINRALCNDAQHYVGTLGPDVICAGFLAGTTPRDSCFGDSGGPLLRNSAAAGPPAWRQAGITSYGDSGGCAQLQRPGVYTRVGRYSDFIAGAPVKPDLAVIAVPPSGSHVGTTTPVKFTVRNLSPINTANSVTFSTSHSGALTISHSSGVTCTDNSGDLDCPLGDLAPGDEVTFEIFVERGVGSASLDGTANSPDGDYYPANNTGSRSFNPGISGSGGGGGGGWPPVAGLLLGLLALRRRR